MNLCHFSEFSQYSKVLSLNSFGKLVRQLVYTSMLSTTTLLFTYGEKEICSTIKKSQNIMNMIIALENWIKLNKNIKQSNLNLFRIVLSADFSRHGSVKKKRVTGLICPWFPPEVKAQMNDKDQQYRKQQKHNKKSYWKL